MDEMLTSSYRSKGNTPDPDVRTYIRQFNIAGDSKDRSHLTKIGIRNICIYLQRRRAAEICGNEPRGRDHRARQTCRSASPSCNPRAGSRRCGDLQGSMASCCGNSSPWPCCFSSRISSASSPRDVLKPYQTANCMPEKPLFRQIFFFIIKRPQSLHRSRQILVVGRWRRLGFLKGIFRSEENRMRRRWQEIRKRGGEMEIPQIWFREGQIKKNPSGRERCSCEGWRYEGLM